MGRLSADALMTSVAHGSTSFLAILNSDRQIVFANRTLIDTFGAPDGDALGRRPGELMGCRGVAVGPDGCGTSPFCRTCGAAQALGGARLGSPQERECRILRANGDPLDLRVTATPFLVEDETFILFSAIDISDAKRRRSLERIFFHDIMNTATGVHGLSSMARLVTEEERNEILELLESASEHLIDEIQGQTELLAAETNDLVAHPRRIESRNLLESLGNLYTTHEVGRGKTITIDEGGTDVAFVSDPVLLCRVVGNLIKNALEATPEGGEVTLACRSDAGRIVISVHNDAAMPEESQLQVFQRSFSTKGEGRGLGTYGSRLLAERYLQGQVSFESTEAAGTIFTVALPLEIAA
jgi:signal transduction histidine kinase